MHKPAIYIIKNIINNKIYIGSAINYKYRWRKHLKDFASNKNSLYLQRSWNKYGNSIFSFSILEKIDYDDNLSLLEIKKLLLIKEQYYLDTLLFANDWILKKNKNFRKLGYNINPVAGSSLGYKHTQKSKDIMSEKRKGIKKSKEHKLKIGIGNKDKIISKETREKIKLSLTGYKHTYEAKTNMSKSQLGRKHTKETKLKIGSVHKNKIVSNETKQKIKENWLINRPLLICPFCKKESHNKGNMNRWHFNNCKLNLFDT